MGIAGPDGGQGGRYLFLPPGYDGEIPDGYFTYHCPTYSNWVVLRALDGVPAIKQTKIYPLSDAADAGRANEFVNLADQVFNTVHATTSPSSRRSTSSSRKSPSRRWTPSGLASSRRSVWSPGHPSPRTRGCVAILGQAATIGAGMSRTIAYAPRDPDAVLYGSWRVGFVGGSHEFLRNGARLLDARTQFHYLATVVTPAMAHAQVGAGIGLRVHDPRQPGRSPRRGPDLPAPCRPRRPGEELLGGRRL